MTHAVPAVVVSDPFRPLLARFTAEALELARHVDGLALPTVAALHSRLADLHDLAQALGVEVPAAASVEQLVARHCGAILRLAGERP